MSSGTGKQDMRSRLTSLVQQRLQATRERVEQRVAGAINSALRATGLGVSVQAPSAPEKTAAPAAAAPAAAPGPAPTGTRAPRPFQPAPDPQVHSPEPAPTAAPSVAPPVAPPPAPRPAALPLRASAPRAPFIPRPQGPTPVQVMTAVQNAFGGAVKVISGTIDGVGAAIDAGRAVGKTATGAASVATGVATVASGFFPRLAALGIGVKKAPKNRPGMPPRRRVADIIANPIGRSKPEPAPGSVESGQPPRPVRRVQRLPMVRPKSSLEMSRKEKSAKPRSYADLQMKPQVGLTPHEILLKVATIALGKTLIGFLESGARAQQKALSSASERLSQKQIMLLGMLPAQYIVKRLPQVQAEAQQQQQQAAAPADSASGAAPGQGTGTGFKIRY